MAKTGVVEGGGGGGGGDQLGGKVMELKKELQRLVKAIVVDDCDDINLESIDWAHQILTSLKEFKIKRSLSLKLHESVFVPEPFRCPLSKELMRDPVIIATGQTYDRLFIQKWLKAGNRTCPRTQQVLSHTNLTPNHLVREMISQWCKNNGIQLPDPVQYSEDEALTEEERDRLVSLLKKMSSTLLSDKKQAAKELRLLTKRMPSFRALFGESLDAVPQLVSPLSQNKSPRGGGGGGDVHPDLQEDIITTLLNVSIHDSNKKLVAESPDVLPVLISSLRSGTIETRSNAAAALFTLSAIDTNKALIGKSAALKPLIELLDEGHPLAMKDAASAIFNLCILHENKARAVRDGAVSVLLKKIEGRTLVDELLAILAMLSSNQRAVEEMGEMDGVGCLVSVMRESGCARNKENCIAILHTICFSDRTKWREVREEESRYGTISHIAQNGTSRAKRKASGILERLNRAINLTHTA